MVKNINKKKIIVICTGNSIRSQIAEGFLKKYRSNWEIRSAGTNPKGLSPITVMVMKEKGIDIWDQESKNLDQFINSKFGYVITVCDNAKESCPLFPGKAKTIHWNFEDPADVKGGIEDKLFAFRKVRDKIEEKVKEFIENNK